MEPSDSGELKQLLQQVLDSQREHLAAVRDATAQTLANQERILRRQRRANWLAVLLALILAVVGAGIVAVGTVISVQLWSYSQRIFDLWDDTFPVEDGYYDEDSWDGFEDHPTTTDAGNSRIIQSRPGIPAPNQPGGARKAESQPV